MATHKSALGPTGIKSSLLSSATSVGESSLTGTTTTRSTLLTGTLNTKSALTAQAQTGSSLLSTTGSLASKAASAPSVTATTTSLRTTAITAAAPLQSSLNTSGHKASLNSSLASGTLASTVAAAPAVSNPLLGTASAAAAKSNLTPLSTSSAKPLTTSSLLATSTAPATTPSLTSHVTASAPALSLVTPTLSVRTTTTLSTGAQATASLSRPALLRSTSREAPAPAASDAEPFAGYDDDADPLCAESALALPQMDDAALKLTSTPADDVAETVSLSAARAPGGDAGVAADGGASALKRELLNALAASLIREPDFYDPKNATRAAIVDLAGRVAEFDGEFLLKAALYTRQELNIRSTANFLLALSAHIETARPHVRRYFKPCVRLPSDWLEVAQYSQTIHGQIGASRFHARDVALGSIPSALRRAMLEKFADFDEYQLGKYNKDKASAKKAAAKKPAKGAGAKKRRGAEEVPEAAATADDGEGAEGSESDGDDEGEKPVKLEFNIKQMVRKLHIVQPADRVMAILGKKYPDSLEAFVAAKLDGVFDAARAGKRMKLPVPETWETQLSLHGNNAATWESLINARKLPYMAMLRNLRNLLQANLNPRMHGLITSRLQDEYQVRNSRQFPLRYFSAYEALEDCLRPPPPRPGRRGPARPFVAVPESLVGRYRSALNNAIRVATSANVPPIRGRTLVLCDASSGMRAVCGSARALGKPRTMLEVGLLLGLMCRHACETCELYAFGPAGSVCLADATASTDNILSTLDVMRGVVDTAAVAGTAEDALPALPKAVVDRMLQERAHVDAVVVLGRALPAGASDFLAKYRALVNPALLFVLVDLSGAQASAEAAQSDEHTEFAAHPNNVRIAGYSDSILRFVAERGDSSLVRYVEAIPPKYGVAPLVPAAARQEERLEKKEKESGKLLKTTKTDAKPDAKGDPKAPPAPAHAEARPRATTTNKAARRTARVFISSTFLDMHGERDLLTRFVFPALRERCERLGISVHEVDLRWGVPARAVAGKGSLEACLAEVERCRPFFVGILGERYGHVPTADDRAAAMANDPTGALAWLAKYPLDRSVTELEAHFGALAVPSAAAGRAFFYLRSASFLSEVPQEHVAAFCPESTAAEQRLVALKRRIRASGLDVFDGYPCRWGGVGGGRPSAGGLGAFGARVAADLWSAIRAEFGVGTAAWTLMREHTLAASGTAQVAMERALEEAQLHDALVDARAAAFFGRKALLRRLHRAANAACGGVVILSGKAGTGKTALLAAFARDVVAARGERSILVHCVGAAPGSADVQNILVRLTHVLRHRSGEEAQAGENGAADIATLCVAFQRALRLAAASLPEGLVVVLDGLDHLSDAHGARSMAWMPAQRDLPQNVVFIASAGEGEPLSALRLRYERRAREIEVGTLTPADRADIVRGTLGLYGKTIDESAAADQLRPLIAKRDAGLPLYLALVCEELRVFGVFERLSERIASLPGLLAALVDASLGRMEADHGQPLVAAALSALACAREGLTEAELLSHAGRLLRRAQDAMPVGLWAPLRRALAVFLAPESSNAAAPIVLTHSELRRAVARRYLPSDRDRIACHKALADSFRALADPSGNGSYSGADRRALAELPYHVAEAHEWKALAALLCDLRFIDAKVRAGLVADLVGNYAVADGMSRDHKRVLSDPRVAAFGAFVTRSAHVFASHPTLAVQQALSQPDGSPACMAARALVAADPACVRGIALLENKGDGADSCELTVRPAGGCSISAVAVCPVDDRLALCGDADGGVVLVDVVTGGILRSLSNAGGAAVGSVCFAGKTRAVVGRADGSVEFYDLEGGRRLSAESMHDGKRVTCVAADPAGGVVASCAWDGRVVFWNPKTGTAGTNGKAEWDFRTSSGRPAQSMCFDSEGRRLAVGGWSHIVDVYDTVARSSTKLLFHPSAAGLVPVDAMRTDVPFSVRSLSFFSGDRALAASTLDGRVAAWSVESGTLLAAYRASESSPANAIAFSPRGHAVAVAGGDGNVHVWGGQLGRLLHTVVDPQAIEARLKEAPDADDAKLWAQVPSRGYILAAVPSPDGSKFAVCFHFGSAAIVDAYGAVVAPLVRDAQLASTCALWTNTHVLVGSGAGSIRSFAAPTFNVEHLLEGHEAAVTSLAYSQRAGVLASTSNDASVRLWRLKGTWSTVGVLRGHEAAVTGCVFSAEGGRLLTVGRDASIVCWNVSTREKAFVLPNAHADWINSVAISTCGSFVVTASNDFNAKVWRASGGLGQLEEQCVLRGHTGAVLSCAATSAKVGVIATSGADGATRLWHVTSASEITCIMGHGGRAALSCALVTGEGESEFRVVTTGDDGAARVWAPLEPSLRARLGGHAGAVVGVAFANGGRVVTCSADGSVRRWAAAAYESNADVRAEGGVGVLAHRHSSPVTHVALSESGNAAISCARDGTVLLWSVGNGIACTGRVSCDVATNGCAFTDRDGTAFVVACDDGTLRAFDVRGSSAHPRKSLQAHKGPASAVACCASKRLLMSGGWDGQLCVFDAESLVPVATLAPHSNWIASISLSADALFFAASSLDGGVSVWRTQSIAAARSGNAKRNPDTRFALPRPQADAAQTGGRPWVRCTAFGPSATAFSVDAAGHCHAWSAATGAAKRSFRMARGRVTLAEVAGERVVMAFGDGVVRVFDGRTMAMDAEFVPRAPCTALCARGTGGVVVGDSLGGVHFVRFGAGEPSQA